MAGSKVFTWMAIERDENAFEVHLEGMLSPGCGCEKLHRSLRRGHGHERLDPCTPSEIDDIEARDANGKLVSLTPEEDLRAYEILIDPGEERHE